MELNSEEAEPETQKSNAQTDDNGFNNFLNAKADSGSTVEFRNNNVIGQQINNINNYTGVPAALVPIVQKRDSLEQELNDLSEKLKTACENVKFPNVPCMDDRNLLPGSHSVDLQLDAQQRSISFGETIDNISPSLREAEEIDFRRRWTKLEDGYIQHICEERKFKFGDAVPKQKWVVSKQLEEALSILNDLVKSKKMFGNNPEIQDILKETDVNEARDFGDGENEHDSNKEDSFTLSATTVVHETSAPAVVSYQPKRARNAKGPRTNELSEVAVASLLLDKLRKIQSQSMKENDELKSYCDHLYGCLVKLSAVHVAKFRFIAAEFLLCVEEENNKPRELPNFFASGLKNFFSTFLLNFFKKLNRIG